MIKRSVVRIFSVGFAVGKATVFCVGLAVLLGLGFALAGSALAADPGDPFRLGRSNEIDALTRLVGTRATPLLQVKNDGGPALNLVVPAGKAPFVVSAGAARVANLDADKLDGQDAGAFATTAQVAAAGDDAWAYVIATGGLHASSGNLTVTHPATGEYCVVVPARGSHKAAQATLADPGGTKVVSVGTGHGSACNPLNTETHDAVPVFVRTTAGTAVDGNFTIVVPAP